MNIDGGKLSVFERKILKLLFGQWGKENKKNELYNLYKEIRIIKTIKTARLKWLGHIAWKEDYEPGIKIKFSLPIVSRKRGRPRLNWLDSVSKNALRVYSCWKKQEIEIFGVQTSSMPRQIRG